MLIKFLTARGEILEKITALSKGVIDFIIQPFILDELRMKLKSILRVKKRIRDLLNNQIVQKISGKMEDQTWIKFKTDDEHPLIPRISSPN